MNGSSRMTQGAESSPDFKPICLSWLPPPSTPFALRLCQRSAQADPHPGFYGDLPGLGTERAQVSKLSCGPQWPLPALHRLL